MVRGHKEVSRMEVVGPGRRDCTEIHRNCPGIDIHCPHWSSIQILDNRGIGIHNCRWNGNKIQNHHWNGIEIHRYIDFHGRYSVCRSFEYTCSNHFHNPVDGLDVNRLHCSNRFDWYYNHCLDLRNWYHDYGFWCRRGRRNHCNCYNRCGCCGCCGRCNCHELDARCGRHEWCYCSDSCNHFHCSPCDHFHDNLYQESQVNHCHIHCRNLHVQQVHLPNQYL